MKLLTTYIIGLFIIVGRTRQSRFLQGGFCSMVLALNFAGHSTLAIAHETPSDVSATVHVVEIKEFKFVPANVNSKPGDTIKWINLDFVPHTATAEDTAWDSGLLTYEAEWEMTVTLDSGGTYICTYHPTMKGTISLID